MSHPYPSRRSPVHARQVVATSQPLAVAAGLHALRCGGNAVDAALATAITLTVVEPTSNGIGSDAFALVWNDGTLYGINGSGRAPAAWDPERFAGRSRMPVSGWDSVTVPGAVDVWRRLSERFGSLPFADLFADAVRHASEGFPVSPVVARGWAAAGKRLGGFDEFRRAFLPEGRAPHAGERFRLPEMAATLTEIAATGGRSFYEGRIAERIVAASGAADGALSAADLADHRSQWVDPVSVPYGDAVLHEIPPNGQGLAALIAAGILDRLDARSHPADSVASLHLQIEAMRVGLVEAHRHVADPDVAAVPVEKLLDAGFLDARAAAIDPHRAGSPAASAFPDHGTVYLATADAAGMMVSFIQSNYMGFGSGIVVPDTGISLQNRAAGFSLEPGHPNRVAGGKRPFHTIIPGFVTRGGRAELAFGVMGGPMQAQGHLQMLHRVLDLEQDVQTAADAPRWFLHADGELTLEAGFPAGTAEGLAARGHRLTGSDDAGLFGGAQLIRRGEGGWVAGSDPRKDGLAAGF